MQLMRKQKKSGRAKFETLRREIKADIRKQHDIHAYVNNLVGDVKANHKVLTVHQ